MPRVCEITGKRTTTGHTYTTRGKAKYLGGIGTKVTGKTKRKFRPNLQKVTSVSENGSVKRVLVSTKAIRSGLIVKPARRRFVYKHDPAAVAAAKAEG